MGEHRNELLARGEGVQVLSYPCEIEFGLHADHLALLLILCAQDLEFCWVERRLRVDGVWAGRQ